MGLLVIYSTNETGSYFNDFLFLFVDNVFFFMFVFSSTSKMSMMKMLPKVTRLCARMHKKKKF